MQLPHACCGFGRREQPLERARELLAIPRGVDLVGEQPRDERPLTPLPGVQDVVAAAEDRGDVERGWIRRRARGHERANTTKPAEARAEREVVVPGNPSQAPLLSGITVQVV